MQNEILNLIEKERERQNKKWGEQNHDDFYWLGIVGEEFGEICKAIIEYKNEETKTEIIHTLAVLIQWYECIIRREKIK